MPDFNVSPQTTGFKYSSTLTFHRWLVLHSLPQIDEIEYTQFLVLSPFFGLEWKQYLQKIELFLNTVLMFSIRNTLQSNNYFANRSSVSMCRHRSIKDNNKNKSAIICLLYINKKYIRKSSEHLQVKQKNILQLDTDSRYKIPRDKGSSLKHIWFPGNCEFKP